MEEKRGRPKGSVKYIDEQGNPIGVFAWRHTREGREFLSMKQRFAPAKLERLKLKLKTYQDKVKALEEVLNFQKEYEDKMKVKSQELINEGLLKPRVHFESQPQELTGGGYISPSIQIEALPKQEEVKVEVPQEVEGLGEVEQEEVKEVVQPNIIKPKHRKVFKLGRITIRR